MWSLTAMSQSAAQSRCESRCNTGCKTRASCTLVVISSNKQVDWDSAPARHLLPAMESRHHPPTCTVASLGAILDYWHHIRRCPDSLCQWRQHHGPLPVDDHLPIGNKAQSSNPGLPSCQVNHQSGVLLHTIVSFSVSNTSSQPHATRQLSSTRFSGASGKARRQASVSRSSSSLLRLRP
jgi:hypothetical protein